MGRGEKEKCNPSNGTEGVPDVTSALMVVVTEKVQMANKNGWLAGTCSLKQNNGGKNTKTHF